MFIEIAEKILNGFFACIPRSRPANTETPVKLIAHRGAHSKSLGLVENTMASFSHALKLGCWGIELDVHSTSDGVIVVNHDPDLKRLWGHPIAIADLDFAALRALEPQVPSLEEVISAFGKSLHYFIEIKTPFYAEEALFKVLKNLNPGEDYHILSLEEPLFASLQYFPKTSMMLVPMHNNVREFCRLSTEKGYGGVLGNYLLLTNKLVRQLQVAKQGVGVGFVNSRNSLYRELDRPIPWIFTDNADEISRLLKTR